MAIDCASSPAGPLQVGDMNQDLVRVLDPGPESMSPVYLLVHPDLCDVPRVRALFDFMVSEVDSFRLLLGHWRQIRPINP